jgi:D-alanyl-D-alanine dipeptidase
MEILKVQTPHPHSSVNTTVHLTTMEGEYGDTLNLGAGRKELHETSTIFQINSQP